MISAGKAGPLIRRLLDQIGSGKEHIVASGVLVAMHRLHALGGGIAGVKGFRRAVAVGDRVGALLKDHDGGPVLVIVQPDMAAWLDLEHAKPELPAGHARNFRSEVDHHGLERRISFVALRVSCAAAACAAAWVSGIGSTPGWRGRAGPVARGIDDSFPAAGTSAAVS